jgi:competence protein ComEA
MVPVHVSGWVTSPGVVWVTDGSLAIAAIEAAGGAREGARLDLINLARPVFEGDQLQVPGPDVGDGSGASVSGDGLIDINTADETELQKLPPRSSRVVSTPVVSASAIHRSASR